MLINIYYSNTTRTQLIPPEEGEGLQDAAAGCPGEPPPPLHKPMYCNSTCHTYIIIQYIEYISSQHINLYQLISAAHTLYYCNIYLIIQHIYNMCIQYTY